MSEKLIYANTVEAELESSMKTIKSFREDVDIWNDGYNAGLYRGVLALYSVPAVDAVEIPCKIGDVVWTWLYDWRHEAGISPYQITNLIITQNKKGIWTKKYRAMQLIDGKIIDMATHFGFDEIGKEVFFSKKEAEKMLLRGEENAVD